MDGITGSLAGASDAALAAITAWFVTDERTGRERLTLHVQGCRLGDVVDKHLGWLAPLLKTDGRGVVAFCGVEFFALQVTGGTWEKPTRGVNFIITGLGDACRALYGPGAFGPEADDAGAFEDAACRAAEEDASGDGARIEATMDAGGEAAPAPTVPAPFVKVRQRDGRGRFLPNPPSVVAAWMDGPPPGGLDSRRAAHASPNAHGAGSPNSTRTRGSSWRRRPVVWT